MKKITEKIISIILTVTIISSLSITAFASEGLSQSNFTVITQEINQNLKTSKQIAQWNDNILYTLVTPEISYCSQTTADGKIQFSYILANDGDIVVSEIYDLDDICNSSNAKIFYSANDYDALNNIIIENISDFDRVKRLSTPTNGSTRGFSTLSAAITDTFGPNYSSEIIGIANKSYNGTTYGVRCTESQSTSNTSPDSRWFAKDTAATAVVAWAISGSWSWIGAVASIVTGVISTVVINGINSIVNSFTAERSNVSLMHTRIVTVNGYSGTQYWAGWTRKIFFFKGELGWTHDTGYNYNIKHSDFDDVSGLMETGFQNFVNYILQ